MDPKWNIHGIDNVYGLFEVLYNLARLRQNTSPYVKAVCFT